MKRISLANFEQRRILVDLLNQATAEYYGSKDKPKPVTQQLVDLTFLHTAGIVGIHEIVKYNGPERDRCAEYVFGTEGGQPIHSWVRNSDPDTKSIIEERLATDTYAYLKEHGYRVLENNPQKDDVVGYLITRALPGGGSCEMFEHFGVYTGVDVVSKFGAGLVYRHDIDVIPFDETEVNTAVFFRKISPSAL